MKRHRKPGVSAAVRRYVLERDRRCFAQIVDAGHECRDRWGEPHRPTDLDKLTIEHVRDAAGGSRFDDPEHLVAMCHAANAHDHWGAAHRAECRLYLAGVRNEGAMHR